jgi:hypothetical protein
VGSAEIYGWRTEDGVYAYTDDRDQVPARYAEQVEEIAEVGLEDYKRYTHADTDSSARHARSVAKRLNYLRAVNGARVAAPPQALPAGITSVSIATGNAQAPVIDVSTSNNGQPIIVEPIRTLDYGKSVTRQTTVVKQGGRTIAILKGQSHEISLDDDIRDERDIGYGE